MSTIAASRNQHFRLLDLPAELRNRIYRLVLCEPGRKSLLWDEERWFSLWHVPAPPILTTCRQIHRESGGYFRVYQHTEFLFASGIEEFLAQASAVDKKNVLEVTLLAESVEEAERMLELLVGLPRVDKITIRWTTGASSDTVGTLIGLEVAQHKSWKCLLGRLASLKMICFDHSDMDPRLSANGEERLWAVEVALNAMLRSASRRIVQLQYEGYAQTVDLVGLSM